MRLSLSGLPRRRKSIQINDLPNTQAVKVLKHNPCNSNACKNVIMISFHIYNSKFLSPEPI